MKAEHLKKSSVQMRRGVLELCVLSIIAEGEVYPTDIIKRLEESELIVVEGTLYPLLSRLKTAGLLAYTFREVGQGAPRKYYTLTTDGQEFLHSLLNAWKDLVQAVSQTTKNVVSQ